MLRRTLLYFILLVIVGITNIFFFFFGLSCRMSLFCLRCPHLKHAGLPLGCDGCLSPTLLFYRASFSFTAATSKTERQCIVNRLTGAEVKHVASAAHRSFYYHKCQRSSSSLARFFYYSGGNVKRICNSHNTATAPKARRRRAITQNATILSFLFFFPPSFQPRRSLLQRRIDKSGLFMRHS